jgi:arylsulfatase A-like enzyme
MLNKFGQSVTATPSFFEAFNFICQWWLFVFVLCLIPLDFIYRFSALFEGMTFLQFGASLVSLVFFFVVVSVGIALASCVAGLLLRLFLPQSANLIMAANALLGLWFLLIVMIDYSCKWIVAFFKLPWTVMFNYKVAIALLLFTVPILIIICYYYKSDLLTRVKSFTAKIFRFNIAIVALCSIGTLVLVSSNLYQRHQGALFPGGVAVPVSRPNIILVTFDALCAQHTTLHGWPRDTTPNLQALAKESYVFDHAYAAGNFTPPGVSSLLSGKYPFHHHILNDYSFFLGREQTENLAFILRGLGYQTIAVVSNQFAAPSQRNMAGFDKISSSFSRSRFLAVVSKYFYQSGLGTAAWLCPMLRGTILGVAVKGLRHEWHAWFHKAGVSKEDDRSLGIFAPEYTFGEATQFLRTAREPFFIWVHIWPPHDPYVPSKKFLYTFLAEKIFDGLEVSSTDINPYSAYPPHDQPKVDKLALRYDENILYADDEFGKFLTGLRQSGLLSHSILIVSADHGEMFEKGFCSHAGPYLYQPLMHIPFILHMPYQTNGQRLFPNVSQVDLAPTLLDYLGLATPPWMDGQSFYKALKGQPYQPEPKFSMNLCYKNDPPNFLTKTIAIVQDNYKLIYYLNFHRYEMYNLQKDPRELHNIVQREPEIFSALKKQLDGVLQKNLAK